MVSEVLLDSLGKLQESPVFSSFVKMIFLNTNACYNRNIALMKEEADVAGQLKYLEDTLK